MSIKKRNPVLNPTFGIKKRNLIRVIYNQTGILWINCFIYLIIFKNFQIKYRESYWSTRNKEDLYKQQSTFDIERGFLFCFLTLVVLFIECLYHILFWGLTRQHLNGVNYYNCHFVVSYNDLIYCLKNTTQRSTSNVDY